MRGLVLSMLSTALGEMEPDTRQTLAALVDLAENAGAVGPPAPSPALSAEIAVHSREDGVPAELVAAALWVLDGYGEVIPAAEISAALARLRRAGHGWTGAALVLAYERSEGLAIEAVKARAGEISATFAILGARKLDPTRVRELATLIGG